MDTSTRNSSGMSQTQSDGLAVDFSALADNARAKLGEIGEPVKDKALEVASQQKDAGADQLQIAARAIHGAARELESEMPQFAGYIHEVGNRLEQAASDVRTDSIDGLMSRLGEFSRNQPALLFGGAMVAGIALSRFLKSSAPSTGDPNLNNWATKESSAGLSGMQSGPMTMQSGAGANISQGGFGGGSMKPGGNGGGTP